MTGNKRKRLSAGLAVLLLAAPAAWAEIGPQLDWLRAHPDWLCGNQPEGFAGANTNTELTIRVLPDGAAAIFEENIVYRHPKEYRATVKYDAKIREDEGHLVLDTYAASLVRADTLPAGGTWGEPGDVHMVLTMRPVYLQPGVWEFTGYSETGLGRIATSCNVPDVGRAPD